MMLNKDATGQVGTTTEQSVNILRKSQYGAMSEFLEKELVYL